MNILEWLQTNGDYNTGLQLYQQSNVFKATLYKTLVKKNNPANYSKLRYELKKTTPTQHSPTPPLVKKTVQQTAKPKGTTAVANQLFLHSLPPELREDYLLQKQQFAKVCFLHTDLVALHPEQEQEALALCMEIETLWENINHVWKRLDFYKQHKIVVQTKQQDFSLLPPAKLLQKRNNVRANITKHQKKLAILLTDNTNKTTLEKLKKHQQKLRQKEQIILTNNALLLQLNQVIDTLKIEETA